MDKPAWGLWIGVDPGTESKVISKMGMMCILTEDHDSVEYIPTHEIRSCQGILKDMKQSILGICIEEIVPHFAKPYGDCMRWHDRCLWLDLKHALIPPAKWQKDLGEHKKKGDKNSSLEYIRARFPGYLAESVGKHTGKADALVLALHAEKIFSKGE